MTADEEVTLRRGVRRVLMRLHDEHAAIGLTGVMILLSLPFTGKHRLAAKLGVTKDTVHQHVKTLGTWGYVRVTCDHRMKDASVMMLTPAGEALFRP